MSKSTLKSILNITGSQCKDLRTGEMRSDFLVISGNKNDVFSLVWWACQKCQPNQQQRVYKPRGIKETARTVGPSEVIYKSVRCSNRQQLKILEDIFVRVL